MPLCVFFQNKIVLPELELPFYSILLNSFDSLEWDMPCRCNQLIHLMVMSENPRPARHCAGMGNTMSLLLP